MSRFVETAIARAGLLPLLRARRDGAIEALRATIDEWKNADLLALGAVADRVRGDEMGDTVVIHRSDAGQGVTWIERHASDLEVLRAVAVARIAGPRRARVGIDWGEHGLELAQVALGFGATDLRGPIARKSGLPILDGESKRVKGQGAVSLVSIKKREIADLVTFAARVAVFADETPKPEAAAHA